MSSRKYQVVSAPFNLCHLVKKEKAIFAFLSRVSSQNVSVHFTPASLYSSPPPPQPLRDVIQKLLILWSFLSAPKVFLLILSSKSLSISGLTLVTAEFLVYPHRTLSSLSLLTVSVLANSVLFYPWICNSWCGCKSSSMPRGLINPYMQLSL